MVFISMDLTLSLVESINLYNSFIKKLIPNKYLSVLGFSGNLYKNGRRKKKYIWLSKKCYFYIQRMVYNKTYYFDLFPLFLVPNSITPTEDLLEQKNNQFHMSKRTTKTKIDSLLEKEDIYNLKTFELLFESKELNIYRSKNKYSTIFRKNKKTNLNDKKHIFHNFDTASLKI